jgi:hypothetical protein
VVSSSARDKDKAASTLNAPCLSLRSVTTLVLDEADRLLDLGFEQDLKSMTTQWGDGSSKLFSLTYKHISSSHTHACYPLDPPHKHSCLPRIFPFLPSLRDTMPCTLYTPLVILSSSHTHA